MRYSKMLVVRDLEAAIRFVLPRDLAKRAISEGQKALRNCGYQLDRAEGSR